MHAPRFRQSHRVELVDDRRLFILNEDQAVIVENATTAQVAALIDGERSPADIMAALGDRVPAQQVFLELAKLTKAGHVVNHPLREDAVWSYVESWGRATDRYADAAQDFGLAVLDPGGTGLGEALADALAPLGIHTRCCREANALPEDADLTVVVVEDYLEEWLADANRAWHAQGRQWMLVKPHGRQVWVGPRFVPGQTGCWACLADRLSANRQAERYIAHKRGTGLPRVRPAGMAPGAAALAAGLVAQEVFAVSARLPGALEGVLRTLDTTSLGTRDHVLVSQPQCAVSGSREITRTTAEVKLMPDVAVHRQDGGYRVCTPAETYARLEHHISPYLGAVTRLDSLHHDRDGITYSFVAGHNFGMAQDNMELLKGNMRGQSGGKGRTEIQAKVSGVCEAIERFSGVWSPDVPETRSTFAALDRRAIHPRDVLLYSDQQYVDREEWNTHGRNRLQRVPEPFREDLEIGFTTAWSLTRKEEVLIPSGLVWFGQPDLERHRYAITDSNGGASGNTLDEGVLQGLCELYERDAVALWWFTRVPRPALDLDSFDDPYIERMRAFYETMQRDIWVLDLSNDLAVPTFAAVSRRRHAVEDIMVAFGSHPDPDIALFRALTELNQFLPFIAERDEAGETVYGVDDAATLDWCRNTRLAEEPWLAPAPDRPPVRREHLTRPLPETLGDLVEMCVGDLDRAGIETIVVNQTRPDIELAVVKVFAPGLRHFWKRTGPGRVYDVPVRLGWVPRPLTEAELNPVGVFF